MFLFGKECKPRLVIAGRQVVRSSPRCKMLGRSEYDEGLRNFNDLVIAGFIYRCSMVVEYLPTFPLQHGLDVGKSSSTMVRIWDLRRMCHSQKLG